MLMRPIHVLLAGILDLCCLLNGRQSPAANALALLYILNATAL